MEPANLPPPPPDPAVPQQPSWRKPVMIMGAVVGAVLAVVLVSTLTRHDDPSASAGSGPVASGQTGGSPAAPLDQRFTGDGVSIKLPQGWSAGPGLDALPQAMQDTFGRTVAAGDSIRLGGYSGEPVILMVMTTPSGGLPLHSVTDMVIAGIGMGSGTDAKATSRKDTTVDGQAAERVAVEVPVSTTSMMLYTWVDGDQTWMAMWIGVGGTDASATYDAAMATLTTSAT